MLADIMAYVPWPGFGPFESYDADETVAGGETLELAGLEIDVIFTPGHSPGHVTYSIRGEDAIFSGDVLFQGSVGRVDLPGGDWADPARVDRDAARGPPRRDRRLSRATWGSRRSAPSGPRTRSSPSWRAGRRSARSPHDGQQVPGTARDLRRAARQAARAGADRARRRAAIFGRAGYEPIATPAFEDTDAVRARGRQVDRHRPQGDVHLRGQGRAQPDPAARGHGADLPRLRRARHAQAGAAGEALLRRARSSATSARRRAATASSTRSALEAIGTDSPLADAEVIMLLSDLLGELGRARGGAAARQPRLARGARAPTWRS